jgi:nitrogen fixation/metabolism regulation signal transduction histidine kinase
MATVGVPLLYDPRSVEERFALTGSVLIAAYLFTLVLVLVGGIWSARRIARPLAQVAAGTRRVAAGELDVVLEPAGSDELGELVRSFNTMTHELKRVTAQAARAEREMAWRRMARQVAHEIKNPLTPIRLMIQQMEADVARDPTGALDAIRRTAPVVLRQIESLGRIAADFAHFARLPKRDLEDVDVTAVARDVVALHGGSAEHGVEVVAEIGAGVPTVHWDAGEIRRVLINLVGNAVQAIPGAGRVRVVVRPAERDGRDGVRVDVADTGTGITEQDLGRLFEPDFSTKTAGTGLGLAMVKRTVDDLGGSITVESTPGEGSTFRMWWPARPDASAATP